MLEKENQENQAKKNGTPAENEKLQDTSNQVIDSAQAQQANAEAAQQVSDVRERFGK